jgi:ADP-L-glycero-D-manno-heptose 6-epimerase
MKIITGGAGFIGSAICWKLNKMGIYDIVLVDTDRNGTKQKNLENLKFADFIDKNTFLNSLKSGSFSLKTDTIYHMGACSSTTEENMDYLKENNFEYSKHLALWCLKNGVKYIYASSGATYGDGSMGFDDDIALIPRLKPLNKYGLSKQMFDMWVIENGCENKFVGLKYFNVFGPNENHKGEMRSMVNKSYTRVIQTGKLQLFKSYKKEYSNGEQKRDFLYVKDAVDMTLFFDPANHNGGSKTGIYNIGSGKASTWNELAYAIFKSLDLAPNIEYVDMPDNIINQYQYYTQANMDKLRKAGYNREVMALEDSVKDYVTNYLANDKYLSISDD